MISTRFLGPEEYRKFRPWLKQLNAEDRNLYFGMAISDQYVDTLVDSIVKNQEQHNFLISYNCAKWLGVLHIAQVNDLTIEFAVSVAEEYRNLGIGSDLLKEGIVWSRNRGYERLYLHCVQWNRAMAHLADKSGLEMTSDSGDIDVMAHLAPASWYSLQQETADVNRRIFHLFLNRTLYPFQELAG